jgi:hypothetical protein
MPRSRPLDPTVAALLQPGRAADHFARGVPASREALCAEMSRLAYCGNRRTVERALRRAGLSLAGAFGGRVGPRAVLATGSDLAVLAFRGTADPIDVLVDLAAHRMRWNAAEGVAGTVHAGFAAALGLLWDDVSAALAPIQEPLWITGHSLGGALAVLAATRAPAEAVVTFGAPRVGDAAFALFVNGLPARALRYVNCCDLVPGLPPEVLGFRHAGRLRYIDAAGDVHARSRRAFRADDVRAARGRYLRGPARTFGNATTRDLADHAAVNYVSALA